MSFSRKFAVVVALTALAGIAASCTSVVTSDSPDVNSRPTAEHPRTSAEFQRQRLTEPSPIAPPSMLATAPLDYPGIHNAVAFHDGFISGSVPEGDVGFGTLQAMGIKTIISVDGAAPELDKASARGIRYIHLPIGYNGFDEARRLELTRAARDALAQGPVYIHCHHGKHRSAGAAAAVAASLAWMTPQEAVERMKVSGTAPNYKGLYACAANAAVLDARLIDSVSPDFPSIAPPTGFVKAMVEIDEISDHLKAIEKSGWKSPSDHPDLVPAAEAGRMADLLRVLAEGNYANRKPDEFTTMLRDNSGKTQTLEALLLAGEKDAAKLSAQFKLVSASCKDCHAKYRD